jgi:hypothetical protein
VRVDVIVGTIAAAVGNTMPWPTSARMASSSATSASL